MSLFALQLQCDCHKERLDADASWKTHSFPWRPCCYQRNTIYNDFICGPIRMYIYKVLIFQISANICLYFYKMFNGNVGFHSYTFYSSIWLRSDMGCFTSTLDIDWMLKCWMKEKWMGSVFYIGISVHSS